MGRPKSIETDKLLAIAREIFLDDGAFGSTKAIAARAGISEAALFKRYPTKAALFLAALAPPPADAQYILAAARAEKDPRAALRALARQTLGYYRAALPRMIHLLVHPAIGIDALKDHMGGAVPLDGAIANFLAEQHAKGRIHAPNAMAAAGAVVALLHSVVLFELLGVHGGEIPPAAVDAMIEILWRGLEPRGATRKKGKRK